MPIRRTHATTLLLLLLFVGLASGCGTLRHVGDAAGPAGEWLLVAERKPVGRAPAPPETPPQEETYYYRWFFEEDFLSYAAGALIGLAVHESGHLAMNYAIGTNPEFDGVEYTAVPFLAIDPREKITDRQHYAIASAGFNAQHLGNEVLLAAYPNLKDEDLPVLKGVAAFNLALSLGYALSAYGRIGPDARDTHGMANALGTGEAAVGTMILVPAALDAYRFQHPEAEWPRWASWIVKLGMIALTFTIDND